MKKLVGFFLFTIMHGIVKIIFRQKKNFIKNGEKLCLKIMCVQSGTNIF